MMTPGRLNQYLVAVRSQVTLRRVVLAVVFTLNLRTFEFFPGGRQVEEIWFVVCLLAFVCLFPLFKIHSGWRFSRLELYLLLTMLTLIVVPATSAYRVFGQPLLYGLLARRSTILLGTWILLLNAWRRDWVDEEDLRRVLLFLTWFVCMLYAGMRLFLNPANFAGAPIGFLLGFGQEQSFSVPGYLLPFGVLYYMLRGIRKGAIKDYLYGLVFFVVEAGSSWRSLSVSLGVTLLVFLFRWRRLDRAVLSLAGFAIAGALAVGTLRVVRPDVINATVSHLTEAVKVATGGGPGADPSANARIEEADAALPYVREHPILGAGLISVQWRGGPLGVLGVYFSDADIGLLGILFSYGLVGLLVGMYQYKFAIAARSGGRAGQDRPLLDGAKGYLVFSAIFSITTGLFIVAIETTSLFVLLVYQLSRNGHSRLEADPARSSGPAMLHAAELSRSG